MSRLDRAIDSRTLEATIKEVRLGNRSDHWRHCVTFQSLPVASQLLFYMLVKQVG